MAGWVGKLSWKSRHFMNQLDWNPTTQSKSFITNIIFLLCSLRLMGLVCVLYKCVPAVQIFAASGNYNYKKCSIMCHFVFFWRELVFCYQNCSDLLWEKIVLVIEKTFEWKVRTQNNFWQQNVFLTCSWRFLRSNKLEQLEFKFEKIIGI